jgi:hypothetical protein
LVALPALPDDTIDTCTVHDVAPAPSAPPDNEKLPAPGVAVSVAPHVVVAFDGDATVCPAGSVSVNDRFETGTALALCVNVMVTVDFDPACTVAGANALAMVNARARSIGPVIARALLPWVVWTALTAIVLMCAPDAAEAAIAIWNVIGNCHPPGSSHRLP